jgi:hypothetical protein
MMQAFQPGVHPDAESLSAFAEQALPAAEREQILAHMSVCARCREVVFLAQTAVEDEVPQEAAAAPKVAIQPLPSWLGIWRWAWIPMGAMALLFGVAVLKYSYRPSSQVQIAIAPPEQAPAVNAPLAGAGGSATGGSGSLNAAAARSERRGAGPRDKEQIREKKAADQLATPRLGGAPGAEAAAPMNMAELTLPSESGATTFHGVVAAKSSSVGGPAAVQQERQQQDRSQKQMQTAQSSVSGYGVVQQATAGASANAPSVEAPMSPSADSANSVLRAAPPAFSANYETNKVAAKVAPLRKTGGLRLPSGFMALSTANLADRVVAIDMTGAMFLSEDDGQHWKAITRQWTGRAVLLRVRETKAEGGLDEAAVPPVFELTNDNLQTWVSTDGKTWAAMTLPPK